MENGEEEKNNINDENEKEKIKANLIQKIIMIFKEKNNLWNMKKKLMKKKELNKMVKMKKLKKKII